jgi:hypothetical protein
VKIQNGLVTDDLQDVIKNLSPILLAEHLHYDSGKAISNDEFGQVVSAVSKGKDGYAVLGEILKGKGYDGLAYTNEFEDKDSLSWIVVDGEQAVLGEPIWLTLGEALKLHDERVTEPPVRPDLTTSLLAEPRGSCREQTQGPFAGQLVVVGELRRFTRVTHVASGGACRRSNMSRNVPILVAGPLHPPQSRVGEVISKQQQSVDCGTVDEALPGVCSNLLVRIVAEAPSRMLEGDDLVGDHVTGHDQGLRSGKRIGHMTVRVSRRRDSLEARQDVVTVLHKDDPFADR